MSQNNISEIVLDISDTLVDQINTFKQLYDFTTRQHELIENQNFDELIKLLSAKANLIAKIRADQNNLGEIRKRLEKNDILPKEYSGSEIQKRMDVLSGLIEDIIKLENHNLSHIEKSRQETDRKLEIVINQMSLL